MHFKHTEELLRKGEPTPLRREEQELILRSVREGIAENQQSNHRAANFLISMNRKLVLKLVTGILIFTSTFATAYAANAAKPGDRLFVVDRALEEIQLALIADDIKEAELKLQFAEERLAEVRAIIAEAKLESQRESDSKQEPEVAMLMSSAPTSQGENEDTTAIQMLEMVGREAGDGARNGMKEEPPRIAAVSAQEMKQDTIENKEVSHAVSVALEYFADVKNDFEKGKDTGHSQSVDTILDELHVDLSKLPSNTHLSIDVNEKKERVRIEVETAQEGDDKIRIRVRDKDDTDESNERLKIDFKRNGRVKMETVGSGLSGTESRAVEIVDHSDSDDVDSDNAPYSLLQEEDSIKDDDTANKGAGNWEETNMDSDEVSFDSNKEEARYNDSDNSGEIGSERFGGERDADDEIEVESDSSESEKEGDDISRQNRRLRDD